MSHWTAAKAHVIASEVGADILAVQETHLAKVPLSWAHGTSRQLGLHLHHGYPVQPVIQDLHGRSCGVGFLAKQGLALARTLPRGAAWRRLYAQGRLHAVRLEKRADLPHGLLLLSVYAPLQVRDQQLAREQFVAGLLEVTHTLDMQVPTLLMGDFNGSADPASDFLSTSGHRRMPCPLLSQLLGPGGAWVDVHRTLLGTVPWTFRAVDKTKTLSASRIDLVLANHAVLSLVHSASVLESVQDGGHCPALVSLSLRTPFVLQWCQPRPKLPELLTCTSVDLRCSTAWHMLVEQWQASPAMQAVLTHTSQGSGAALSAAMVEALHSLVELAGGWGLRPPVRRSAYDSNQLRTARKVLADLLSLASELRKATSGSLGSWPRIVDLLLCRLGHKGCCFPQASAAVLLREVEQKVVEQRLLVHKLERAMRQERHTRWKRVLPELWRNRRGVVYHWLHNEGAPWGATPILGCDGLQCTTPAAVDTAVREFWVGSVLRRHVGLDDSVCWAAFQASQFAGHIPKVAWPSLSWSADRVQMVLQRIREGSAPGLLGIPIAVWKVLPNSWHEAVARLLALVEAEGVWPKEWVMAYVAMIPKSSGGSRPQDQRPITVLDLLYRVWSKGVVLSWQTVLQQSYLGQAAMGFRAGAGTLHVAQILSDLMLLQRRRRKQLWLASFDVATIAFPGGQSLE